MTCRQRGYPAYRGRSYAKIEFEAQNHRTKLAPECGPAEALPGLKVFESLYKREAFARNCRIPLDYAVNQLPSGVEGLTMHDENKRKIVVVLSTESYELLESEDYRARFSLFHEIGHAVLHTQELIDWARIPHQTAVALLRGTEPAHADYLDTEWQAHAFASALLMPAEGLALLEEAYGQLTIDVIQDCFGVSAQAAKFRLQVFLPRRASLLVPPP